MNERIREFDDSAHFYADEHWVRGPEWHEFYIEKFAELIVQECAEIALLEGQTTGNFEVFNKIQKHFGAEE